MLFGTFSRLALQLQPQESQQKIRLFLEPDTDDWIEAELAFEQDGRLVSRLFDAAAQESLGMEVYLDGVVLTPAEQAFCCLYALLQSEEAKWVIEYLRKHRSRKQSKEPNHHAEKTKMGYRIAHSSADTTLQGSIRKEERPYLYRSSSTYHP